MVKRVGKFPKNYRPPQSLRVGAEVGDYTYRVAKGSPDGRYIDFGAQAIREVETDIRARRIELERGEE